VALAQCAAQDTPLMLIDEPVSFQDPAHQSVVAQWLCSQSQRALVFSAHDVNWVALAATHVLMLLPPDAQGAAKATTNWIAGPVAEMLTAERLAAVFGCAWREAAPGVWAAA
jgi:iron complex transport system ATP-binding protein